MEYDYKYDLRETVSDLFKCLVYSYLLSFLLLILRTFIASLLSLPARHDGTAGANIGIS